jgi:hypothetical protein
MMVFPFQLGSAFATSGCASKRTAKTMMSALTASASVLGMILGPILIHHRFRHSRSLQRTSTTFGFCSLDYIQYNRPLQLVKIAFSADSPLVRLFRPRPFTEDHLQCSPNEQPETIAGDRRLKMAGKYLIFNALSNPTTTIRKTIRRSIPENSVFIGFP